MRVQVVVLTAVAVVLLAGCSRVVDGTASPASSAVASSAAPTPESGPALVVDSADALEKAGAVDVTGTMTLAILTGDMTNDEPVSDVTLHLQGSDLIGTRTVDGQLVTMIRTGGVLYERGPAAFWATAGFSATASRLADAWVRVPDDARAAGQWDLSVETVVHQMQFWAGSFDAGVSKGTRDGQDVWQLSGQGSVTEVAATGPPYPLHIGNPGGEPGDVVLGKFGVLQTIVAPPTSVPLPAR